MKNHYVVNIEGIIIALTVLGQWGYMGLLGSVYMIRKGWSESLFHFLLNVRLELAELEYYFVKVDHSL